MQYIPSQHSDASVQTPLEVTHGWQTWEPLLQTEVEQHWDDAVQSSPSGTHDSHLLFKQSVPVLQHWDASVQNWSSGTHA